VPGTTSRAAGPELEALPGSAFSPVGHYLAGPSSQSVCAQRDLWIQAIWGRPGVSDAGDLLESLKVQPFDGEPHAALQLPARLVHLELGSGRLTRLTTLRRGLRDDP
jgi:hypothetical protein